MTGRWLILGLVFAGAFATTYLLSVTGQLPAAPIAPLAASAIALKAATMLTLIVGYGSWGWRVVRAGAQSIGTAFVPDFAYHGTAGGRFPMGASDRSQIEASSGTPGRKGRRASGR